MSDLLEGIEHGHERLERIKSEYERAMQKSESVRSLILVLRRLIDNSPNETKFRSAIYLGMHRQDVLENLNTLKFVIEEFKKIGYSFTEYPTFNEALERIDRGCLVHPIQFNCCPLLSN